MLPPAKGSKPHSSLDLILGLAAVLAVVGLGVNTVRQMPDQQAKTLRDGLIGSAAGLLLLEQIRPGLGRGFLAFGTLALVVYCFVNDDKPWARRILNKPKSWWM